MSNKLLSALFGATFAVLAFSPAAFAEPQVLADFHAEMGECESCHANGEPSADSAYENEQCQSCHGSLAEMSETHKAHDGMLNCSDCHVVHEMNVGDKPTCDNCHDDGRK